MKEVEEPIVGLSEDEKNKYYRLVNQKLCPLQKKVIQFLVQKKAVPSKLKCKILLPSFFAG